MGQRHANGRSFFLKEKKGLIALVVILVGILLFVPITEAHAYNSASSIVVMVSFLCLMFANFECPDMIYLLLHKIGRININVVALRHINLTAQIQVFPSSTRTTKIVSIITIWRDICSIVCITITEFYFCITLP